MNALLPQQPDAFARLDRLFAHALSLGEEADTWLDTLKDADAQFVSTLRSLLDASRDGESAVDTISTTRADFLQSLLKRRSTPLHEGERVGGFVIESLIGQGGFSNVYRARRDTTLFEQTVALKVFHAPIVSEADARRFADECSALARVDHPNIARIIDGGSSAESQAWIAMEFVDGAPVTQALATAPRAQRLDAVVQAATAISEAHRQRVLHLDLKPSNVLLDTEGRVRVLDFGLAQLLGPMGADAGAGAAAQAMTPAYAAPEQMTREAVSVATDVFMLGGLLQELLTGQRPEPGRDTGLNALPCPLRQIIAACRREDPDDRYASVDRLISDLERYRDQLPISLSTRPGRDLVIAAIRRNPWAASLSGMVAVILIGWAVTSGYLSGLYEEERDRAIAQQATAEATTEAILTVFRRADPLELDTALQRDANAWQYLAAAADGLRDTLQDQPEALIEILRLSEALHTRAGQVEQAAALRADLAVMTAEHFGPDSLEAAMARIGAEALQAPLVGNGVLLDLEQSLARFQSEAPTEIAYGHLLLAYAWRNVGDENQAARLAAMAVERLPDADTAHLNTAIEARLMLGQIANGAGRPGEAITQLTQTIAMIEQVYGPEHARIVGPLSGLAGAQRAVGEYSQAIEHQLRAIAIQSRYDEPASETLLNLRNNLALTYRSAGLLDLAESEQRTLLALEAERSGGTGFALASRYQNLATTLEAKGTLADARQAYATAAGLFADSLSEQNATRWLPYISLARVHLKIGDEVSALGAAQTARNGLEPILPADHFALDVLTCLEGAILKDGPNPVDRERLIAAEARLKSRPRRDEERGFCLAALGQY